LRFCACSAFFTNSTRSRMCCPSWSSTYRPMQEDSWSYGWAWEGGGEVGHTGSSGWGMCAGLLAVERVVRGPERVCTCSATMQDQHSSAANNLHV
jgi:hypothetical protein